MPNVRDDDLETLWFAEEDDPDDHDEDRGDPVEDVADLIADWFGRSVIDPDRELAKSIIQHLGR
jgi:hypothetical protein